MRSPRNKNDQDQYERPEQVRLSEDEIRARATSIRTKESRAEKVVEGVSGTTQNVILMLLTVLRIPIFIVAGFLGFAVLNGLETTNLFSTLIGSVVVAVVVWIVIELIRRRLHYNILRQRYD